jgi:hypothetical protein
LGRRTGFLALPSGVPQKMYLRMPDGSYQFGWAQALAFGGADNGIECGYFITTNNRRKIMQLG